VRLGRYMLLKSVVGFGVFLVTCPLAFLLIGFLGSLMPKPSFAVAAGLGVLAYILGSITATHLITEKLSQRWSH